MPEHKRQHYVPRCYFKSFSHDGEGSAINLFNIARKKAVPNAAVKGQCAKDYLYGEDLTLERLLQEIEGTYSRILKTLRDGQKNLSEVDLAFLRRFMHLQFVRTDMAVRRFRLARVEMQNAIFEGQALKPSDIDLSDRTLMRDSMRTFADISHHIDDLKVCLVENTTDHDFVISDDPSIFTNKYHFQKLNKSKFGLASSGALFVMPLTPRLLGMCYDGKVYTIPEKSGDYVTITEVSDVLALNELQYLKAAENLYFSHWQDAERLKNEFEAVSHTRPDSWCEVVLLVLDKVDATGEHFRLPNSEEERRTAKQTVAVISAKYPCPSTWISKLKYRNPPRTYSNGSAVGHVRKREWLEGQSGSGGDYTLP